LGTAQSPGRSQKKMLDGSFDLGVCTEFDPIFLEFSFFNSKKIHFGV